MELTIGLPLRNHAQLTNLLHDIYDPSSPRFRHFLKADEFATSFGPTAEDYQAVIDFAKAHHLTVTHAHSNRTLVDISGSVTDVEKAFKLHMRIFKHPKENRNFFAPDVEPSLDLKTPVLAISGLDNYVRPTPRIHTLTSASQPGVRPLGGGGGGGADNTGPFQGSDFLLAYAPNVSQDGTGQSVGLFELFGFSSQDIQDYEDQAGIFPYVPVTSVLIDGASNDASNVDYLNNPGYLAYALEVTGDIEMAISMAPGLSSVLVYEGPTPQDVPPLGTNYIQGATTTAQINDVLNRMATDNLAKQLSCSYGFDVNLSTAQIFEQYAAQGQSFFLASGDAGAFVSGADQPADDPYVTVVGGTTLAVDATNGTWASETAWLTPASNDPLLGSTPEEATGGGVSLVYGIPDWQQGVSMTANQGSTTMRNVPDVSMVANNINVVWGTDLLGSSTDFPEGGTSLAAPLWAALVALANQQAASNGQPPVGFVNPALYAIGKSSLYQSCFHDITTGSNTNNASPTKFQAVAGYDLCTGWGTPNGDNLIPALLSPPLDNLRIVSPLGFTSQGRSGGPFSVTKQPYTLTNTGPKPLIWNIVNTSSWLTVSAPGGTLNPGGPSTIVTVSLSSNANALLITHGSGNVTFNNFTAGTTQNRQFDLYVGNGGFESGDLSYWNYVGDTNLTFALAGDDADVAGRNALPGEPDQLFVHSGIYGGYLGQWPTTGTLSQTVPTIAGQKLLVSFWVTSVPGQGKTIPNNFAAKWDGATLFSGTNLPVFSWTNMQFLVSGVSTSGTLEFDFDNTPGAFGLDDITVEALPAPILTSAMLSNGNIALSWNAFMNVSYQIQSGTDLARSGWTNVGSPFMATSNIVQATLPTGNASTRFYRVVMSP